VVSTRLAIAADADDAVSVLRRSIVELCAQDHQNEAATLERWLGNKTPEIFRRWLDDPESHHVVAETAGSIVGVAALHRSGEVRLCYVRPGCTGLGVGRSLLSAIEGQARHWGLESVHLCSTLTARDFYERSGYVASGEPVSAFGVVRAYPYAKTLAP